MTGTLNELILKFIFTGMNNVAGPMKLSGRFATWSLR
jgi:hypothetical protein